MVSKKTRSRPLNKSRVSPNKASSIWSFTARGAKGVVHACQFCDVVQRVWDLLDAGREEEARGLHEHLLPGLVLEGLMGMAFAKEIMVRRGVFWNHRIRSRARPLDEDDVREIDRVWDRIQPYLSWQG